MNCCAMCVVRNTLQFNVMLTLILSVMLQFMLSATRCKLSCLSWPTCSRRRLTGIRQTGDSRGLTCHTVSSHKFSSQHAKSRVSNPRAIVCYAHFRMPFESSRLPVSGPVFPDFVPPTCSPRHATVAVVPHEYLAFTFFPWHAPVAPKLGDC